MSTIPDKILVLKVPYNWYQVIKAHYIVSGSDSLNMWCVDKTAKAILKDKPEPGMMVMFLVQDEKTRGDEVIVGGGFYINHEVLATETAWAMYGVRNGALDYEDFLDRVKATFGRQAKQLNSFILQSTFIFSRSEHKKLPSDFNIDFQGASYVYLDQNEPLGRYLVKIVLQARNPQLNPGSSNSDWKGIYLMATQSHSIDYAGTFYAKMLHAYNYRCGITGTTARPVIDVAHIRTFYDERFQRPDNGIVMRCDLHRLFSKGLMTAGYDGPDTVRLKVSTTLKALGAESYMKYDGTSIMLPEDKAYWPNPDYLTWHERHRFENWIKFGVIKPVDVTKA